MDEGLELMLLGISFILFGILMGNNGGMFFGILGFSPGVSGDTPTAEETEGRTTLRRGVTL